MEEAQEAAAAAQAAAAPSGLPLGHKCRVLVVDDDPLCLMIVAQMLKRCDYDGARGARPRGTTRQGGVPKGGQEHRACE